MRVHFLQACVIIFSISANAQTGLISTFNSTHSGRSISLIFSNYIDEKNEVGFGIRYNINRIAHSDDQNNVFKKRLYATEFIQHIGAEAFYHWHFFPNWEYTRPFLFYDLQVAYSSTRNRMFLPGYFSQATGILYYKEIIDDFGPFGWVEQCVGIGFEAKIYGKFYLFQKIGFGTSFILGKDGNLPQTLDKFEWEFAGLLQAGVKYKF